MPDERENKQAICNAFAETLRMTRQFHDLVGLRYEVAENIPGSTREIVTPVYTHGNGKAVDVTADSGTAMIRDIMRWIS